MIDALFGSKTRVKLLNLFMNSPDRTFYVREITRKIDEQINSVRRELANMLEIGIVRSDSKENKIYYGANKSHPFFAPLRKIFTSKEINRDDDDENAVWVKRFYTVGDVKLVIFSGKLVNDFDSDVDLLVVGNVSKVKLGNLVKIIEAEKDISVAYASMTYEDFYYRKSVQDQFVGNVLNAKHIAIIDNEHILENGK
ncbi:MAG: winged helix-turn-helix domain-containing protein [Candidatus Nomurabacteria bacterium]|jgi:hypothetical protein|nr:winged helix-turn-helix domain-containing protein [Candidatus Nomurabacteria bacterium]